MTIGGLILLLAALWACVELAAYSARHPSTDWVGKRTPAVTDSGWQSRKLGLMLVGFVLSIIGVASAIIMGLIWLLTSGVLNIRIF